MDMITKIQIIILILSIIDLIATYFYISTFHTEFPKLNALNLEANPILRLAMGKLGILLGMIVGGIIVFAILCLIVLSVPEKWLWYLCGVESMMIIYHLLNFVQLAGLKPATGV